MLRSNISLEDFVGIKYFITDTPGIGGYLRREYNDFIVREVPAEKSENEDGDYTHFTLEKTNWDTIRSISALSRAVGVSRKRFGFAGTKDKRAVTLQRMAVWKVEPERLKAISIKDIKLSNFTRSSERLLVGDLLGNDFAITVKEPECLDESVIEECNSQIKKMGVPNYFGYQRFGVMRPNTHMVGRMLIEGDVKGAVMSYLADYYDAEREDAREARKMLKETMDFKAALQSFPKRLGYERTMIDHLYKHPTDFAGAFRRLHKKLRQMFVHGYQSYLFNLILSRLIESEIEIGGGCKIPLFGFLSSFSPGLQGEIERGVLESNGMDFRAFKLSALPELSSRGAMRTATLDVDVKYDIGKNGSITFNFYLTKGNYATMVMREFMKTEPLNY